MFSKRTILFFSLIMVLFIACKKDFTLIEIEDTRAMDARRAMLQHRWDFDLFTHDETINNVTTNDSIIGLAGDFFEFTKSDTVLAFFDNRPDTTRYQLLNLNQIKYANDVYTIETLTSTDFVFTINRDTDSTEAKDKIWLSR